MSSSNDSKGTVKAAVIGGIIGGVFLVLSTLISGFFLLQSSNIRAESSGTATAVAMITQAPLPTYTVPPPLPTYTPPPTYTPRPTLTPVPTEAEIIPTPTETPIPEPTALPDSQPGSILDVGQTWRQGEMEMRLVDARIYPELVWARFNLRNNGTAPKVIRYGPENFSGQDNRGKRLEAGGVDQYFGYHVQKGCDSRVITLDPQASESIALNCSAGNDEGVTFGADYSDPTLTEIIITVSGISSIQNAAWRVPIGH